MAKQYNLARMTTATVGTGTITLGSAVSGYLTFAGAGVANSDVVSYGILDGANSEVGTGTYTTAGTTLSRTVTKSTNSNTAISLSGAAEVYITFRAEDVLSISQTQSVNTVFAGPSSGGAAVPAFRALVPADLGITNISNSIGGDVLLNNVATFFDGPSVAQGTSGTWFASGTVTLTDTANSALFKCKLWDGTTVIASCDTQTQAATGVVSASLSGVIAAPAGNIRISVEDASSTSGKIFANISGLGKDSTVCAIRIA